MDPLDTSAGGVAREQDLNKLWNRPGFRTVMRYAGNYNRVGGTIASITSVGDDIGEGNWGSAALAASAFVAGSLEIGGAVIKINYIVKRR
jgi:hypothetical protein